MIDSGSKFTWIYFVSVGLIVVVGCNNVPASSSTPVETGEIAPVEEKVTEESATSADEATTGSAIAEADPASAKKSMPTAKTAPANDPAPELPSRGEVDEKPRRPKVAIPVPERPEYTYEPNVLLSEAHARTCLVGAGDQMPSFALPDLKGDVRALKELLADKLTVIVFWSNKHRFAREQVSRLNAETALPFQDTGVQVIAINVGDPPEQIRDVVPSEADRAFTVLLDEEGEYFGKIATEILPRTYVLDSEGRIKWFDIEYSRSSRRDLLNALHVFLGDRTPSER